MQAAEVYATAWAAVKTLVSRCYAHGIGVLIDLHAVPGGANAEAHSGTSSGKAELWANKSNLNLATSCLTFIAEEIVKGMDGVIGIQVCNESAWDPPKMYRWYENTIEAVARIDPTIPIYISDGWDLGRASKWALGKNSVSASASINPVVVDTHKYWTFSEKDTCRGPSEIIAQVKDELVELEGLMGNVFENKGATATFIGEYSCTLSPQTWARVPESERARLTRQFGHVQSECWQSKACGSTFWTFKMDWMPGGDWGFVEQVEKDTIIPPPNLRLTREEMMNKLEVSEEKRSALMMAATEQHNDYWDSSASGRKFEHWRFDKGWRLGWTDAKDFFVAQLEGLLPGGEDRASEVGPGGDKIGALDLWVLKRMKEERCADRQTCGFGWEWEQGFRKGVDDFYEAAGI